MQFKCKYTVYLSKTFLFQANQFSQTVLIQTIQFSISMLLVLFNPQIGPYQVLPFRPRVNLGAIAMKGYSTFHKAPESDCLVSYPGHSLERFLPLYRDAVSVYNSPSRLIKQKYGGVDGQVTS